MNKKRTILVILAMMLVCVLSVAGTMAYLQSQTTVVTNTFIAAGGTGPFVDKDEDGDEIFEIKEYEVTQDTTGKYNQTETEVEGNNYTVMPGTVIPKEAFVRLSRTGADAKTEPAPAYLFLEVKNTLDADKDTFEWSVDADNWEPITAITDREIYIYKGEYCKAGTKVLTAVNATTSDTVINIVTDGKIVVDDNSDQYTLADGSNQIQFYAYLAQASVVKNGEVTDAPADVFNACFGTTNVTPNPAPEQGTDGE